MLLDFALLSVLLVFAHLLRARVRLLQNLLLPAPILAGLLGLAGGPGGLDVLPVRPRPGAGPAGGGPQRRRHVLLQPGGGGRAVRRGAALRAAGAGPAVPVPEPRVRPDAAGRLRRRG